MCSTARKNAATSPRPIRAGATRSACCWAIVLFAHALDLATTFDEAAISRTIARAATAVCTGEILQTQRRFDLNLSLPDYYRIIEMKTAALFGAAAGLGATLNGVAPASSEALKVYGLKVGTAYQVYDDLLDLAGRRGGGGQDARDRPPQRQADAADPQIVAGVGERPARAPDADDFARRRRRSGGMLSERVHGSGAMACEAVAAGRALVDEGVRQLDVLRRPVRTATRWPTWARGWGS